MDSKILQQQQQQLIEQYKSYTNASTKRILIVNYEDDVNFALKLVLEEEGGFQVDFSNDPILALNNFKNGSYDLLIISIVIIETEHHL
jgi:DNA-binding NtrC family response regulator